jgi:hypothetical protein
MLYYSWLIQEVAADLTATTVRTARTPSALVATVAAVEAGSLPVEVLVRSPDCVRESVPQGLCFSVSDTALMLRDATGLQSRIEPVGGSLLAGMGVFATQTQPDPDLTAALVRYIATLRHPRDAVWVWESQCPALVVALTRNGPACDVERLWDLDDNVRHDVAADENTGVDSLAELASSWDSLDVLLVAGNPMAPRELLDALSSVADSEIRAAVVANDRVDEAVHRRLAGDPSVLVRAAVAERAGSVDILTQLVCDPDPNVRSAVAKNPKTPDVLAIAAKLSI